MTNERIIQIDSVDAYNKLYGWETLHPLVTVVNHANPMASDLNHSRLNYGLYALFLKQGDGCSIRYGREKYDYQEGTVVSFKPGQVVEVEWDESRPMPPSRGLLCHPDLLFGTQLARRINDYTRLTPIFQRKKDFLLVFCSLICTFEVNLEGTFARQ